MQNGFIRQQKHTTHLHSLAIQVKILSLSGAPVRAMQSLAKKDKTEFNKLQKHYGAVSSVVRRPQSTGSRFVRRTRSTRIRSSYHAEDGQNRTSWRPLTWRRQRRGSLSSWIVFVERTCFPVPEWYSADVLPQKNSPVGRISIHRLPFGPIRFR